MTAGSQRRQDFFPRSPWQVYFLVSLAQVGSGWPIVRAHHWLGKTAVTRPVLLKRGPATNITASLGSVSHLQIDGPHTSETGPGVGWGPGIPLGTLGDSYTQAGEPLG